MKQDGVQVVLAQPGFNKYHRGTGFVLIKKVFIEYVLSFLVAFLFFFSIFLINQLIVIFRDIIAKGVDPNKAFLLLLYALPAVVALASPFGSLVGALLVVSRMSASNEIIALQSLGFSIRSVLIPVLVGALGLSMLAFTMNNIFLPLGTIEYKALTQRLLFSNTELVVEPNSVKQIGDVTIVTQAVHDGFFENPVLFDHSESGKKRVISAKSAAFDKSLRNLGALKLDLSDVTLVEFGNEAKDLSVSKIKSMSYMLSLSDISGGARSFSPAEMGFIDIYNQIKLLQDQLNEEKKMKDFRLVVAESKLGAQYFMYIHNKLGIEKQLLPVYEESRRTVEQEVVSDPTLQINWIEFSKKLAIPFGCFTLVILGFPLGMMVRKSARGLGLAIGLLIAAVYWFSLLLGQSLAVSNLNLNASLIIWLPNILFGLGGIISLYFMMRR